MPSRIGKTCTANRPTYDSRFIAYVPVVFVASSTTYRLLFCYTNLVAAVKQTRCVFHVRLVITLCRPCSTSFAWLVLALVFFLDCIGQSDANDAAGILCDGNPPLCLLLDEVLFQAGEVVRSYNLMFHCTIV